MDRQIWDRMWRIIFLCKCDTPITYLCPRKIFTNSKQVSRREKTYLFTTFLHKSNDNKHDHVQLTPHIQSAFHLQRTQLSITFRYVRFWLGKRDSYLRRTFFTHPSAPFPPSCCRRICRGKLSIGHALKRFHPFAQSVDAARLVNSTCSALVTVEKRPQICMCR